MYQRYFGKKPKNRYSLAHTAGFFGMMGTFIVFFPFLYRLLTDGKISAFYANLFVFVLQAVLWIVLYYVTKQKFVVLSSVSNFVLWMGCFILAYHSWYSISLYQAFLPITFPSEALVLSAYLALSFIASILLIADGWRSYHELSGRFTRITRKFHLKRNLMCLLGAIAGILSALFIRL